MKTRHVFSLAALALMFCCQTAQAQFAPVTPLAGAGPSGPAETAPAFVPPLMIPPPPLMPPPGFPGALMPPPGFSGGVIPASFNDGCGAGKSDCDGKGCDSCGKGCSKCGCACGENHHAFTLFGEFLYLNARDSDIAYGVEVDSAVAAGATPVQVGRIGVVDPDYQPGFRFGANYCLDECSSVSLSYTMWEAGTYDFVTAGAGNAIQSLVVHPTSLVVNSTGIQATAQYDLSMDIVDADYRELISYDCYHAVSVVAGVRYAGFEQQLLAQTPINGNRSVFTDIDFHGAGLKLGLEAERTVRTRGFVYSKLYGSLLGGKFAATFDERDAFDASVVDTEWEAERILSMIDFEVGFGWKSKCDNWKFNFGYIYSAWHGMVKTDEWITGVQTNNLDNLRDVMTFDGLTAKIEGRF